MIKVWYKDIEDDTNISINFCESGLYMELEYVVHIIPDSEATDSRNIIIDYDDARELYEYLKKEFE